MENYSAKEISAYSRNGKGSHSILIKLQCLLLPVWVLLSYDEDNDNMKVWSIQ